MVTFGEDKGELDLEVEEVGSSIMKGELGKVGSTMR